MRVLSCPWGGDFCPAASEKMDSERFADAAERNVHVALLTSSSTKGGGRPDRHSARLRLRKQGFLVRHELVFSNIHLGGAESRGSSCGLD